MSGGEAAMNAWIAKLRRLPELARDAAPDAAQAMHEANAATIAAGTTPSGAPWKPRVDGGQPLRGAAGAVTATARGSIAALELSGPEVFHHRGTAKDPRREIVPTKGLPARFADAIRAVLVRRFRLTMGAR